MFCMKCGTELPEASTFCLKCGYKNVDPERIIRSHRTSNILFAATIGAVVLGLITLFFLLRNHEAEVAKLSVPNAGIKALPSPSEAFSPSPSPSISPSPTPSPLTDIRTINFKKLSYKLGDASVKGSDNNVQTIYGDLDGDGKDEAIVNVTYTTGGEGAFSRGLVYAIKEGKLQRVTEYEGGDKAKGGIIKSNIADGKLDVERCVADETDNSLNIETTTYQLQGNQLTPVDKKRKKANACL